MSSPLRFEGNNDRGPTAELWAGVADWVNLPMGAADAAIIFEDFHPFLGTDVGIAIGADTGAALADNGEPYGVLDSTADIAADAVAGYLINAWVDLDASTFTKAGMEAKFNLVDDNASTQAFIGFTDEAIDGFFGTDNTPDGSSFGLRWNGDETVDLVSIASDDTITVVIDSIATVERTVGEVKMGFTIEAQGGGNYLCRAVIARTVSDTYTVTRKEATTSTVPGAAMKPAVIHTNDNEAAPNAEIDWHLVYNKSNVP